MLFQNVFPCYSIRHILAGEFQVQVSVQQTITDLTPSTAEVSLGFRGTIAGYISKHITSHSFGGQSCYSGCKVTVSRHISCSEKDTPAQDILLLGKRRLYSESLHLGVVHSTTPPSYYR